MSLMKENRLLILGSLTGKYEFIQDGNDVVCLGKIGIVRMILRWTGVVALGHGR